jgi:hypothetical protein
VLPRAAIRSRTFERIGTVRRARYLLNQLPSPGRHILRTRPKSAHPRQAVYMPARACRCDRCFFSRSFRRPRCPPRSPPCRCLIARRCIELVAAGLQLYSRFYSRPLRSQITLRPPFRRRPRGRPGQIYVRSTIRAGIDLSTTRWLNAVLINPLSTLPFRAAASDDDLGRHESSARSRRGRRQQPLQYRVRQMRDGHRPFNLPLRG